MRKHFPLFLWLPVLCAFAWPVMAQTAHVTAFTGVWKLNVAKSRFNPGPPFKSFTLTFTPDGTRRLDLIRADGEPLKAALPWSDGKEVAVAVIEGMRDITATSKIEGQSFHDTWKENGNIIERVYGAVSPDGKVLTITVNGVNKQGGAFHNRLKFEKQ